MSPNQDVDRDLTRAERAVLNVLPRTITYRRAERGSGSPLIVGDEPICVVWAGEGTQPVVRRVLADRSGRIDVVSARRLSPAARELLSSKGIGWVDETGAAEIALGSIIVSRTGQAQRLERPPSWTSATVAVAEAILCGKRATVAATQDATGLSMGACAQALKVLTTQGLLEANADRGRNSARHVVDLDRLLGAYAAAVEGSRRLPMFLQVSGILRDPVTDLAQIGDAWAAAGVTWAATGAAGASVLAPFLAVVSTAEAYVEAGSLAELESAAAEAGLRPIEGGRLTLRPFPTVPVQRLAQQIDGLWVAPWPRVYVDLRSSGVRGEEAAEHLREVIDAT